MSEQLFESILDYLTPKRMASIGNIAAALECAPEELIPQMQEMEKLNLVRLATSSCSSDCSSCSSCGTESNTQPTVTDRTIAISLQKVQSEVE